MIKVHEVIFVSAVVAGLAACDGRYKGGAAGSGGETAGRTASAGSSGQGVSGSAAVGGGSTAGAQAAGSHASDGGGGGGGGGGGSSAPEPARGPVGYMFGPVGMQLDVVLGSDALTASISAAAVPADDQPAAYYVSRFQFPNALDASMSYDISLGTPPTNQTCKVFMGDSGVGSALMTEGAIRVGCEWRYDYVSRSTDSSTYGSVTAVAIGGANTNIGDTEAMGEGRFVVFRSSVNGLAGNSHGYTHIFWRDRLSGITRLVSHAPDGSEATADSDAPAISADGLSVIFSSSANNLVPNDTNKASDIFVWSALDESVTRVSVGPSGEQADAESDTPTISGDGKIIAFVTNATTIAPTTDDGGSTQKVVRIDRTSGERTVISRNKNSGAPADGSSPMLSENGQRLVFQTFRDMAGDINTYAWDIFVYDHESGETWPVTLSPDGAAHDGKGSCVSCGTEPAISGDGKWITFADGSSNLAPAGVTGATDSLMHYWLVEADACKPAPGTCHIVPVDIAADDNIADAAAPSYPAPLSYDGRYVSFASVATNLGAVAQRNIFVFDRDSTSRALRVSALTAITENSGGTAEYTAISRGAGYVTFKADAHLDPRIDSPGAFVVFTELVDATCWYRGSAD